MKIVFTLCVFSIFVNLMVSINTAIFVRPIAEEIREIKKKQEKGFIAQRVYLKCPKNLSDKYGEWCFKQDLPKSESKPRRKKVKKIKLEELGNEVKPGPNDIVIGPKKIPDGGVITCESGSCVWIPGVEDGE